ncbi:MAG TPA: hypothetical protein DEO65_07720 [Bacillus bacterium]|uniref:Uncharacterized protein n=1 Tax=Siminovitchia fordii TaxID=254759 RepID=A0ABQ4KBE3_9BACI|nr:hypothetical protein [Siminovitchia fordii]GIN22183.1 hypothetical protein J1TS3_33170 [Siminovitchia fordii]HBZ09749.1 hypothetical protein [Bacillus sp. (in: firmicutes)]
MNWAYLSADKGSMTTVHRISANENYTYDWEGLYKNWNCLFVNLKWLSENWESHYGDQFERKEAIYRNPIRKET